MAETDKMLNLSFPTQGIDVSTEYSLQPPGTTPTALNVRAFEPGTLRQRGGQRAGITKYIDALVGSANVIQHLNVIVDPTVAALPDYDPPGGITGGTNPGGGGGTSGTTTDPTETTGADPRNPTGRIVRYGGTGIQPTKKRKKKIIQFVQGAGSGSSFGGVSQAYPASVTQNDLLLTAVIVQNTTSLLNTVAVTDSRGSGYSRVGNYVALAFAGTNYILSLWYAVAPSSGADTVTITTSDPADVASIGIAEYINTKISSPFDANSSNSGLFATTTDPFLINPGSISVGQADSLVVVAVGYLPLAPLVNGISPLSFESPVAYGGSLTGCFLDQIAGSPVTPQVNFTGEGIGVAFLYLAIGASFKPQ